VIDSVICVRLFDLFTLILKIDETPSKGRSMQPHCTLVLIPGTARTCSYCMYTST